ncbi:phosphomethylpyrimidine kinase [Klebsiella pneumoniae]|nr:phosphomethylpyrimidine kinase [Klebsiella pneumoniae]SXT66347.1 phosphomethylpyrimidine kinase [Klebsiella pneumoniae]
MPELLNPAPVAHLRHLLRAHSPLVHCMTNDVVQTFTANVLLAVGASPAMVIDPREAAQFAAIADALLINVGTLTEDRAVAMRAAVEHARQAGKPWTLDPVAVGALTVRTAFCHELLALQPATIRGNASEILALAGMSAGGRGVDTTDTAAAALPAAQALGYRGGGHWRGGLRHRRRAGAQRGGGQSADDPGGGHRLRAVGGGGGERGAAGRPAGKRGRRLRADEAGRGDRRPSGRPRQLYSGVSRRAVSGGAGMKRINALTIAGTDPSGGAGIQADLKTFSALGAYGCSAITALVAQNTRGVQSVYRIEPDFVAAQLDSVFSDVRIDTTKIGMLAETDIVEAVAERLARYRVANVVLDTVMLAKSGDPLLSASAVETLRQRLLPQVSLITPNLPEAAALLDAPHARNEREMLEQGRALLALGCGAVLMKGGHLDDAESPDWLFTREGEQRFTAPRVQTKNTHGTGCTLSAALAALRPRHADWAATVIEAKAWLSAALAQADSLEVGHGIGPVHHFHAWW